MSDAKPPARAEEAAEQTQPESYASQFAKAYPPGAVIDLTEDKWAEPRDGRRRTW